MATAVAALQMLIAMARFIRRPSCSHNQQAIVALAPSQGRRVRSEGRRELPGFAITRPLGRYAATRIVLRRPMLSTIRLARAAGAPRTTVRRPAVWSLGCRCVRAQH